MGKRQSALQLELQRAGFVLAHPQSKPGGPRTGHLPREMAAAINHLAASFGAAPGARFAPGAWDIALAGGLLVELDEQSHFNRYRTATLNLPWSPFLPWHGPYSRYCPAFEYRALAHGGYWANRSSTIMFGGADRPGVFGYFGSPRWKQRAVYDAIKDAWALSMPGYTLTRLSIYDTVGGVLLDHALEGRAALDPAALRHHVESRVAGRQPA